MLVIEQENFNWPVYGAVGPYSGVTRCDSDLVSLSDMMSLDETVASPNEMTKQAVRCGRIQLVSQYRFPVVITCRPCRLDPLSWMTGGVSKEFHCLR